MTDAAPDEIRSLVDRALGLPPNERAAFLERESRGDADLRRHLEALVASADQRTADHRVAPQSSRHAMPSAADVATTVAMHEVPGSIIGPYKVLQLIGEGGFGSVFLAEQERPVHRRVALKLIKLGMDTRQVVARFEQERQALAMMDHPNIAKVLDAGATEAGRPYFVMELVRGVPITDYCDRNLLTMRERLALFIPVCHAVQHAHQKGIIHRDIKPSNILVTLHDGSPVPKVIDFGIAKATGARLTEKTLFTEHRQLIGTPAYMSPEQAEMSGLDVDTRTDVYSLGVLLYELLTGTTPFDTKALLSAGYAEIRRLIREVDPPKPSTRASSLGDTGTHIAAQRRTDARRLGTLMRGDLDWIVMKALEKDRTRRYDSAGSFAADVQRHLNGEPVEAAPPSRAYRVRKFVSRRRGLVAALVSIGTVLVAGVTGTTLGIIGKQRALDAESKALAAERVQRQRAQATTDFLKEMLASVDPEKARGREVTVKDVLDRASDRLNASLIDEPEVEATLRQTLGNTYNQLARYHESKEEFARALEIRLRTLGPDHPDTLSARFGLGVAMLQLGDIEAARQTLQDVVEAQSRVLPPNHPDTLDSRSMLGYAMQLAGDEEGALAVLRDVLALQVAALGSGHKSALETMCSVADVLQNLGRLDEAEKLARDLVGAATAAQGAEGAQALVGQSILVSILNDEGRYADAEALGRQVLSAKTRIYGPDHTSTIMTAMMVGTSLENQDKFEEAISILTAAEAASVRTHGSEHPTTLALRNSLARNLQLHGDLDQAESLFRATLEVRRRVSGETATPTLAVMNNLGLLLLARSKPAEAEAVLAPMLVGIEQTMPAGHWMRGQAKLNLGRCLSAQAKYAQAEPLLLAGYEELAAALPEGHDRRIIAVTAIAEMYERSARPDAAAAWRGKK